MAEAAAARSSSRAAATETRVLAHGKANIKMEKASSSSVRVHGSLIIIRETLKIGDKRPRWEHDEEPPYTGLFGHRKEIEDPSLFRSHVACRDLIQRILAEEPVTGQCDLAADNWEHFKPHEVATTMVAMVRRDTEDESGVVPAYAFDIRMDLQVNLIYSEPMELLLACKEVALETVSACGRKRRREPAGEMCAICLWDFSETKEEETIRRLPCSHAFHSRCILPWFRRVSTCPTCRRDAADEVGLETGKGNDDDAHGRRQAGAGSDRPSLN